MKLAKILLLVAGALWPAPGVYSQISVSSQDLLGTLGKTQTFDELASGTLTIDIGNPGGPQLWNFAGLAFPTRKSVEQYLAPQNTPYVARFSAANFAYKFTSDLTGAAVVYAYWEIATTEVKFLGSATVASGIETIASMRSYSDAPGLPMTFGRKWKSAVVSTVQSSGFTIIDSAATENNIDAWGTARLAFGDVECLRTHHFQTSYQTILMNGQLFRRDTTRSTSYSWISKNYLEIADIPSVRDQTNSRTVIAGAFSRLAASQTAVGDEQRQMGTPARFDLAQNFPNPMRASAFNLSTKISFSLPSAQTVTLKIFDLTGKEVATLLKNVQKPMGTHELAFDANYLPNGVYFYRVAAGSFMATRKMLLVS